MRTSKVIKVGVNKMLWKLTRGSSSLLVAENGVRLGQVSQRKRVAWGLSREG